ncbi:MAG TPA: response regulator transcription factor [Puia sp.]|nr:response regulator transcription factor [Puia sp.]
MKETISLALVDDQKLFRQSLAMLISPIPDFRLTIEAESAADLLQQLAVAYNRPDIILMDMEMPGMDGIELKEILQRHYPRIRLLVLSVHGNPRLIAHMIESGCSGYLLKNCDKAELITAIHSVAGSGFYINAEALKAIREAAESKTRQVVGLHPAPDMLSPREKEILRLICKELTNAEIAKQLFISIRTVEGHRNNLLLKTGCRNTAGLVLFAVRNKLAEGLF